MLLCHTKRADSHAKTPGLTCIPVVQLLQRYVVLCRDGQARVVRPDHMPCAAVRQRPDTVPDLVHAQVERPLHVTQQAKSAQSGPVWRMYRYCSELLPGVAEHEMCQCRGAFALALAGCTQLPTEGLPTHHGQPPNRALNCWPAQRPLRLYASLGWTIFQHTAASPPLSATSGNCTPSSPIPCAAALLALATYPRPGAPGPVAHDLDVPIDLDHVRHAAQLVRRHHLLTRLEGPEGAPVEALCFVVSGGAGGGGRRRGGRGRRGRGRWGRGRGQQGRRGRGRRRRGRRRGRGREGRGGAGLELDGVVGRGRGLQAGRAGPLAVASAAGAGGGGGAVGGGEAGAVGGGVRRRRGGGGPGVGGAGGAVHRGRRWRRVGQGRHAYQGSAV